MYDTTSLEDHFSSDMFWYFLVNNPLVILYVTNYRTPADYFVTVA